MKLNQLPKTTTSSKKRLGRGYGSGVGGHTSTRGQKGQKSRSTVKRWFEGGQLPLTKKLPFLRGKYRFKTVNAVAIVVNLRDLENISGKSVTPQTLVEAGLISLKEAATRPIKILGSGEINKALNFKDVLVSESAAKKITKAGGKIE